MKKYVFLVFLFIPLFSFIKSEENNHKSGEKLIYSGSYNMSGLMTPLAQVIMSTKTISTSKNSYLHLNCELATYSKWDSFFKIRDIYEAYVNPSTLKPSLYKRNINEGGYTKSEKYVFKNNNVTSTVQKRNRPEVVKNFQIGNSTQDVISLFYKIRTLDFSGMKVGQSKSFVIVFDEKEIPVTLKYLGNETVSAANLGKKVCHKLSIGAKTNALKGKDQNLIWLTADSQKVPVLLKFNIPVGNGQLVLTSATGI
jgi:hypothetical protein